MTLESALPDDARGLARWGYAVGERAMGAWRSRSRYQPTPPRPNFDAPNYAEVVARAQAAGALESLAGALEALCAELPQLPAGVRGRACCVALDALLMLGERRRALELATAQRSELEASAQGVGRLECLGISGGLRSPDGGWNLLGASLRLRTGELGVDELTRAAGGSPWTYLSKPELGLLLFNALWPEAPERALGCLSRFARAHGLREAWQLREGAGPRDLLNALQSRAVPPRRGPLVSVVVAAHNAGVTLGGALDSLLAQTHSALEILVADDASTDDTAQVMKRYRDEPRVRVFRSEGNQGAYNVRNQLAAQARGELLTFHDADDWALPARIAKQLSALQKTRAHGCVASLLRVSAEGEICFFKNQRAVRLSRVSLLLRRETFAALGGFRSARVGADQELAQKLSHRWGERALVRCRVPLMLSRFAPGSATASPGTESAPDGYCAPIRRAYSQLVFDRYVANQHVSDDMFEQRLRETNNWLSPTSLRPL